MVTGKRLVLLAMLVVAPVCCRADGQCPPYGYSAPQLSEIRRSGFNIENDAERNALAIALLACVADPNPDLRDGVAYAGIAAWLRARALSAETIEALYANLLEQISSNHDPNGFQQPFAALILSEVARTDRIEDTFTSGRRDELVAVASNYLSGVRDYRGFSETEGWRHGVAHGSDLILQLALNTHITAPQIRRMMAAVATQVAPSAGIFYHYGEPERLARAVYYAWKRGIVDPSAWVEWFDAIAAPHPLDNWNSAFLTEAGLARRHNTLAFLLVMHLYASDTADKTTSDLDRMVMQAIRRVMGG